MTDLDEALDLLANHLSLLKQPQASIAERMGYPTTLQGMKRFIQEVCGLILIPPYEKVLDHVFGKALAGELIRVGIRAGRGNGKTIGVAAIQWALFLFLAWDWCNLGGSQKQAEAAYSYIGRWAADERTSPFIASSILSETTSINGNWISVLAASEKSTRSPHPGGPDHGGGLVMDEEAEMAPHIAHSAKPIVNSGNPSAIIRASTPHRETGTFRELIEDHEAQGYELFSWDIFDAMQRCTLDCSACPVKEFAQDTYTTDRNGNRVLKHAAFCGGRAHQSMGWIPLAEVVQQWKESDLHTWIVEFMGRAASRTGFVYDPQLIDEAIVEKDVQLGKRFQWLDKALGIDWGFAGQTAVIGGFRGPERHAFVYSCALYTGERMTTICGDIVDQVKKENIRHIYADAAGAFENAELQNMLDKEGLGVRLQPIAFGTQKDFGIGNITNLLEKKRIHFIRSLNGVEMPNFKRMIRYLKGYERDENGKPKKKDDHVCFVAGTPVLTPTGEVPIESLRVGDLVITPSGSCPVLATSSTGPVPVYTVTFSNGRELTGTGNHPIYSPNGSTIRLDALMCSDIVSACESEHENQSTSTSLSSRACASGCTLANATTCLDKRTASAVSSRSTARSTRQRTARSRRATTSTTRTTTTPTTNHGTSCCGSIQSTPGITSRSDGSGIQSACASSSSEFSGWQPNGTPPMPVGPGTASMVTRYGRGASATAAGASDARDHSGRSSKPASALRSVGALSKSATGTGCRAHVPPAERHSTPTSGRRPAHAPGTAHVVSCPVRVSDAPVHNLTIAGDHRYFASGILVSNCDALLTLGFFFPQARIEPEPQITVGTLRNDVMTFGNVGGGET